MGKVKLEHVDLPLAKLDRRSVLKALATLGVAPALAACGDVGEQRQGPAPDVGGEVPVRFLHGVASGDPEEDSILLWTRVTPDTEAPVPVAWELAADPDFMDVVASGVFVTDASRDYTVKVEPQGLDAHTTYWYRFRSGDAQSSLGRTKTTPQASAELDQLRFAFSSCAWYSMGFFNAYSGIAAKEDLDLVFTLGDYIYEYGGDEALSTPFALGRYMEPAHEIVSLQDYRTRHALYKTDLDLQAAHAAHPWVCTWDDHESTNNSYTDGADNHTEGTEGGWEERKRIASQAYFEWMPIRDKYSPYQGANGALYRRFRYGNLVEFFVLDTRLEGRSPQAETAEEAAAEDRHMMSPEQENWLLNGMRSSPAKWKVIAQQTMLSQLLIAPGRPFGYDAWDGYVAQRNRLLSAFEGIENVVVLTGDIHTAFCNELVADPDAAEYQPGVRGSVGVEFVCPSITSQGLPPAAVNALQPFNRHMRYAEGSLETNHGYVVVSMTPQRCDAAWMYSLSVLTPTKLERAGPIWGVNSGEATLTQSSALPL